ncbi:F-box domain [Macleaya cordata]|uniref:F-box domain n=1 Tax=Macleaya cordata TaxID=56857 RepID=A0A200QV86_MACCD|nr:F-box domain [Macleaya cordata]
MDSIASTSRSCSTFEGSSSRRRTGIDDSNSSVVHPLNRLDTDLMETILARLPVIDVFRCQFVCKRWQEIIQTPNFLMAFNEVFNGGRGAWFFMLDFHSPANVVYDMEVNEWRQICLPIPTDVNRRPKTPVASSGGLMLFRTESEGCSLIVCNPLTGSACLLPTLETSYRIKTIAMNASGSSFAVFVVFGKSSNLQMVVFSSINNAWIELPFRKVSSNNARAAANNNGGGAAANNNNDGGDMGRHELRRVPRIGVMEWTPMREMSSGVTKIGSSGQVMVYFISPSGRVLGYDSQQGTAILYPKLLPDTQECGFDLVECSGHILVVVLTDTLYENARLRIWELETTGEETQWKLLAAMPPFMSREYHGIDPDINCAGHRDNVMVCLSSESFNFNQVIMYNITDNTWLELPVCFDRHNGDIKRFVSAYSFMPDVQANLM